MKDQDLLTDEQCEKLSSQLTDRIIEAVNNASMELLPVQSYQTAAVLVDAITNVCGNVVMSVSKKDMRGYAFLDFINDMTMWALRHHNQTCNDCEKDSKHAVKH